MARETVGEAYILMRADGRLLERDMRREAKKGAASPAAEWRKAFTEEISNVEQQALRRFRRTLAESFVTKDYGKFRKEFGSIGDTVRGVTETLESLRAKNMITARQLRDNLSAVRQWGVNERKRMLAESRQVDQDFNEISLRNQARYLRRLQSLYADADRTNNWNTLARRGEAVEETVRRITENIRSMGTQLGMTDEEMKRLSDSVEDWGRRTEAANDRARLSFGRLQEQWNEDYIRRMGRALAESLDGGSFANFTRRGETARQMLERLDRELRSRIAPALRMTEGEIEQVEEAMRRWADQNGIALPRSIERTRQSLRELNSDIQAQSGFFRRARAAAQGYARFGLDSIRDGFRSARRDISGFVSSHDTGMSRVSENSGRANRSIAAFNLTIGRAFGKGSRNNFVNFVGVVVKGMLDIVRLPVIAVQRLSAMGDAFQRTFSASRAAGVGRLTSSFRGLSAAIGGAGGVVSAIVGLLASMAIFGKVLPAIASAFSLVAASVTLLAGALVTGLIGALLALTPAVVAAVAGIAVFAGAIANMPENTLERVQQRFERMKDLLADIGTQVAPQLLRALDLTLTKAEGLVRKLGDSIVTILTDFNRRLASPEMDQFTEAWGRAIPTIVTNLGVAINALGEALTAFFVPILPYAERLSANFRDLTERFSAWARSADGQNSIARYMDTAWTSAEKLWTMLGLLVDVIGNIFTTAADIANGNQAFPDFLDKTKTKAEQLGTSNGVLDMINGKLEQFNTWLESDEGRESLRTWFEDAVDFMGDVYDILSDLGEAFDELDSPEGRESLRDILATIETLAGLTADVASFSETVGQLWDNLFKFFTLAGTIEVIRRIGEELGILREFLLDFGDLSPERIAGWLISAFDWIAEKATWLWDLLFGNSIIPDIVNGFQEWFGKVPGIITGALGGVVGLVTAPFIAAAGILGTTFGGIASNISTWASNTRQNISTWASNTRQSISTWASNTRQNVSTWASNTRQSISTWASNTRQNISTWASNARQSVSTWASNTRSNITTWASNTRGTISGWGSNVRSTFTTTWTRAQTATASARGTIVARVSGIVGGIRSTLSGLPGMVAGFFQSAWQRASSIWGSIQGLVGRARSAVSGFTSRLPWNASGNVYYGPTVVGVGEAGPEAIVPLNRPLSQVDPSVRALSAIAQGKAGAGMTIERGAIEVNAPNADPVRVAESVLDHLAEELQG